MRIPEQWDARWFALMWATLADRIRWGAGAPEGAVSAPVGTLYLRQDGGVGSTLYVKESGTGNTGWAAK